MMPIIGWSAGKAVYRYMAAFDHWIAFGLLAFIGSRMLWGALHTDKETDEALADDPTSGWTLALLSVATSIDALAVGLSLAIIGLPILVPAIVIGLVAAALVVSSIK